MGILLQTFNQVVIVAAYYANKDYIAKNLCENRNKPKLHCDGKCCLKRKLAKEGSKQAPASGNQKDESVQLFYSDNTISLAQSIYTSVTTKYVSFNELKTYTYHSSVFHPPGC